MTRSRVALPIDAALPELQAALAVSSNVVLHAPPGAGKTTRVPAFLDEAGLVSGKIVMLEPRRVAARASATRIAQERGEEVGKSVGYAMRGERKTSSTTRIEVVTEGILTRMIQSDAELSDIGCLIFDEFHERSLHADLGLALALDVQAALRPDLKIVVMSATLDTAAVAGILGDAPVVAAEGRSFEVETRWLDAPWRGAGGKGRGRGPRFEDAAANLIETAVRETATGDYAGSILAFLPGAGEIARVQRQLSTRLPELEIAPLYGALPFKAQLAALKPPSGAKRKLVLATAIAETSLTIPDVRVVVDGGLARRARFDPGSGMNRLVTERVTKAEATQRQGRAGRVATGVCYRMWTKGEEGGLAGFPPVAITDDDLLGLALELAQWGVRDASELRFLTPPPAGALDAARALLRDFGALDEALGITAHGRKLAGTPFHPRLAHMVHKGAAFGWGTTAVELAALLEARDPTLLNERALGKRLAAFRKRGDRGAKEALARIKPKPDQTLAHLGVLLATGFPDRIARRRKGGGPDHGARYLMASGKGAVLPLDDALAGEEWLAIGELDGNPREAAVRLAAPLTAADVVTHFGAAMRDDSVCVWDKRSRRVVSERRETFGAIILSAKPEKNAPQDQVAAALCEGVADLGLQVLPWTRAAELFQARVVWAKTQGGLDVADLSSAGLAGDVIAWLAQHLSGMSRIEDLARLNMRDILGGQVDWNATTQLDQLAPETYLAPTGRKVAIDYSGAAPMVAIRLQEMFGLTAHPVLGLARVPLVFELLSPAGRPLQKTADLPGFWQSSYSDVRKDMRARYPKHPWPENPAEAAPTRRAKPRKN